MSSSFPADATILLVDPAGDLRDSIGTSLREAGCRVVTVAGERSARQELGIREPSLVITDVLGVDAGAEGLCREMRRLLPGVPVVVVTIVEGDGAALAAGASGMLSRPIVPQAVREVVSSLLADDEPARLIGEAATAYAGERWDEVQEHAERLLALEPTGRRAAWAWYVLGHVHLQRSDKDEAVAAFEQLIASGVGAWRGHARLGRVLLGRGELREALDEFERSLAIRSGQADTRHEAVLLRSRLKAREGSHDAASAQSSEEPSVSAIVADDDGSVLELVTAILELRGFTVRTAANAEDALELAREERPDVMLLDVLMPGLSGLEACARIKRELYPQDPPKVAVMSAVFREPTHQEEARARYAADDFLVKPFAPTTLATRLRRLVEH